MSDQELLRASLDNTSINEDKSKLGNSNPTYEVFKQCLAKASDSHSSANESQAISGQAEAMSESYSEISLQQGKGSKDVEKASNSDESNSSEKANKHLTSQESDEKQDSEQDFDEDVMTGSYGEISLDLLNCDKNSDSGDERCFFDEAEPKDKKRPDSLVLTSNASASKQGHQVHQSQQTSGRVTSAEGSEDEFAAHSSGRVRTGSDTSGLSDLQGTLTVDGDVVTFVAEDLAEKIKMSSPISRWTDMSSFPGSRSSTPSLYKQALQPNHHVIDPTVITDLETHAKKVATCVDTMLENLSGTLQSISSLTVDCMETYENSVCKTCDAVDLNIKAVYQLMAKCEELNNSMGPLYCLSSDMKYIKMMLEQLEHAVEHKS